MIGTFSKMKFIPMVIASLWAPLSHAATIGTFNFDNDPVGAVTPFTDTGNGISATFSSPLDPAAFLVAPTAFQALSGNVLGSAFGGANELDISFNAPLTDATLVFATSDFGAPQPFDLQALYNGTVVGSAAATGIVPDRFTFPEGEIAFAGQAFNHIVLTTPNSPAFAIDNLAVAEAPEPSSASLLLLGLFIALVPVAIRRASRSKVASGTAGGRLARTALAAAAGVAVAGAAVRPVLPLPATSTSTVPANGDVNPYGVAFVPRTVAANSVLKANSILVGNMPTADGTSATAQAGSLFFIDRNGNQVGALTSPNLIDGPWGLVIHALGRGLAQVFISNVLNRNIIRLDIAENGERLAVLKSTVIVSGATHRPDPAALELGPSGLAYDAAHDILYFADSADNSAYAIPFAGAVTGPTTFNAIYQDNVSPARSPGSDSYSHRSPARRQQRRFQCRSESAERTGRVHHRGRRQSERPQGLDGNFELTSRGFSAPCATPFPGVAHL